MGHILMGIGASHSPQLNTPLDLLKLHMERDYQNRNLLFRGQTYTYEALCVQREPEGIAARVDDRQLMERYDACEAAIARLSDYVQSQAPDVLVVLGDDQRELFLDDGMPVFSVFWGAEAQYLPRDPAKIPPSIHAGMRFYGDVADTYPCCPELGLHLVTELTASGFDVAQLTHQAPGRSIGHAYSFTRRRLMGDRVIPMVPIMVNTYYPPNQPTAERCYRFGQALAAAISSWPDSRSVGIVASGGLSHFVVDEALDHLVINAIRNHDGEALMNIRGDELQSGSSEIRNWIAAAGALEALNVAYLDYVPAYRTPAGTGCGMTFAIWN